MKNLHLLFSIFASLTLLLAGSGCNPKVASPRELLEKYFSSAVKQDYETTYTCYYSVYKAKINKEEFMKHRKEASELQSYKIISLNQTGNNNAQAEVLLTFSPSEKLKRKEPVTTTVVEDLTKENGEWKIQVWR